MDGMARRIAAMAIWLRNYEPRIDGEELGLMRIATYAAKAMKVTNPRSMLITVESKCRAKQYWFS